MWPLVSLRFLRDMADVLEAGTAHSRLVLAVYGGCNVMLTALQALWTMKIVQALYKLAMGEASGGGKVKES